MQPRVLIHLQMKSTANGGRNLPFFEGYRPHLVVAPDGEYLGVRAVHCPGPVEPGKEAEVEFELMYDPNVDYGALRVGIEVEMREGGRTVAVGRVVRGIEEVA